MNKPSQQELWEKIQNFQIDDPASTFPFSKKLAKEINWSPSFTNNVIAEYRKFIFLCCISPNGASPSEIVDKVWHLHLTYTDNYWNLFCKQTLNKEIHHYPSKGGTAEKHKHTDWYDDTLQLYESTFDHKPAADTWPKVQLQPANINEPVYTIAGFNRVIIGFGTLVLLYATAVDLFHTRGQDFLIYYLVLGIAGIITLYITQRHKEKRLKNIVEKSWPQNFTRFQMARFLYGSHRAYQTMLIDLLKRGIIETHGSDYKIAQQQEFNWEQEENPLLQPLMQTYAESDFFTYNEGLGLVDTNAVLHPGIERLHRLSKKVDYQKLIIPGIVLLIGFARFLQGISNNKPVGLLVFEMIIFSIVCLMILQNYSYTRLVRLQLADSWEVQNEQGHGHDIIRNFSILGPSAITGFAEYAVLTSMFNSVVPAQRKWTSGDSAGCSGGSSCSSDGGSSCGGCGGGD